MENKILIIPTNYAIYPIEEWYRIPDNLIPDAEKHYLISTWGRVYNEATKTILPQSEYKENEYITLSLTKIGGGHVFIQPHRILLMTLNYIPGCELLDVNHRDGIKCHNWIWNLEWATRSENIQHALNNGLFNVGSTRDNTKLTEETVHQICKLIQDGYSASQISSMINIPDCNIVKIVQNIINGFNWKYISKLYDFSNAFSKFNFSIDQINQICGIFESEGINLSYKDILDRLNIDYSNFDNKHLARLNSAICSLRKKKTYKDICDKYNY